MGIAQQDCATGTIQYDRSMAQHGVGGSDWNLACIGVVLANYLIVNASILISSILIRKCTISLTINTLRAVKEDSRGDMGRAPLRPPGKPICPDRDARSASWAFPGGRSGGKEARHRKATAPCPVRLRKKRRTPKRRTTARGPFVRSRFRITPRG